MPMALRVESMPDDPHVVAILDGPIVLAGDLGREGLEAVKRYGPSAPQVGRVKTPVIPVLVGDANDVVSKLVPDGAPLHFKTSGLAQPHDVSLRPFYEIADQRYTVYWSVYSPQEWSVRKSEIAAADARHRSLADRTIDVVSVDDAQSERAHGLENESSSDAYFEGRRTREAREGWFSYDLAVTPDRPAAIVATYRGGEGRRRVFDVLVDGQKIATESLEYHPTEALDKEYTVPINLVRGRNHVTVKFQAQPQAIAGPLIELRTVSK